MSVNSVNNQVTMNIGIDAWTDAMCGLRIMGVAGLAEKKLQDKVSDGSEDLSVNLFQRSAVTEIMFNLDKLTNLKLNI